MPSTPLNVLLLVIDDLRPELASYGFPTVTPHLDAFASSALTFTRAYVQYSHCSPSRNSFLSGRSPQTTGRWADPWFDRSEIWYNYSAYS